MFIDPKTKTMDNWIYVKGRRNPKGNYQQLKKKKGWKFYSVNNKLIKVSYCAYYTIRIMDGFFANKITILTQGLEHNVSSDKAKNFCFDKEILDQLPEECFSGFDTGEHYMHEAIYATEEDLK